MELMKTMFKLSSCKLGLNIKAQEHHQSCLFKPGHDTEMQTVHLISMKLMFERLNLQAELEFKSMRTPIQSTGLQNGASQLNFHSQFSCILV
jgi:hypothetical protein